jgi:hypothetical protein
VAEDWKSVTTELLGFLLREIDLAREERMRPDGGQRAGLPRGLRLLGPVSALEELSGRFKRLRMPTRRAPVPKLPARVSRGARTLPATRRR